jgi:adenosylcobinamide-phosphate synthase
LIIIIQIFIAFILDKALGEPKNNHPLVIFGAFANKLEAKNNQPQATRMDGIGSLIMCVLPVILIVAFLQYKVFDSGLAATIFGAVCLYITIGWQSLFEHTTAIIEPLKQDNLAEARQNLAMIVSRDTAELDEQQVVSATLETLLENGNDAIFGALFWFILLGPAGAVLYRLVNTLDAMWGYKNDRFLSFGWAAARLDDVLNWVPARLCAYSYALAGNYRSAMTCWKTQAPQWKSPNAGPVMASGAGALSTSIGGDAIYHGKSESKPMLGTGDRPTYKHIEEARQLINKALLIWLAAILVVLILC